MSLVPVEIYDHLCRWVVGPGLDCSLPLGFHLNAGVGQGALLQGHKTQVGRKELHEEHREDEEDVNEVPCHQYGLVEVFIVARSGADILPCGVAAEVSVQLEPGKLRQEQDHQADTQEAKPQGAALVGGGAVDRRP